MRFQLPFCFFPFLDFLFPSNVYFSPPSFLFIVLFSTDLLLLIFDSLSTSSLFRSPSPSLLCYSLLLLSCSAIVFSFFLSFSFVVSISSPCLFRSSLLLLYFFLLFSFFLISLSSLLLYLSSLLVCSALPFFSFVSLSSFLFSYFRSPHYFVSLFPSFLFHFPFFSFVSHSSLLFHSSLLLFPSFLLPYNKVTQATPHLATL